MYVRMYERAYTCTGYYIIRGSNNITFAEVKCIIKRKKKKNALYIRIHGKESAAAPRAAYPGMYNIVRETLAGPLLGPCSRIPVRSPRSGGRVAAAAASPATHTRPIPGGLYAARKRSSYPFDPDRRGRRGRRRRRRRASALLACSLPRAGWPDGRCTVIDPLRALRPPPGLRTRARSPNSRENRTHARSARRRSRALQSARRLFN